MGSNLRRRGGVYWFRRRVPDAIRAAVGKNEISHSLMTASPSVARARAKSAWLQTEAMFLEMARNPSLSIKQAMLLIEQLASEPLLDSPTSDELVNSLLGGKGAVAALLFNKEAMSLVMDLPDGRRRHIAAHLTLMAERMESGVARLGQAVALDQVDLEKHRGSQERARADEAEAALMQTKRAAEVAEEVNRRLAAIAATHAEPLPAPVLPPPALPAQPDVDTRHTPSAKSPSPMLSVLAEDFFRSRLDDDGMTHQVVGQERGTVRRFIEACSDRRPNYYGRGDVSEFLGIMRKLPATYGKSPKDKDISLTDLIARADKGNLPRVKAKTAQCHLTNLSQLFRFAVDKGHMSVAERAELVGSHRVRRSKDAVAARDERGAWTSEELVKLFDSPVWRGCHPVNRSQPGDEIIRDAKFWIPLLALFHGARLEEFADLYRRDIQIIDGTWVIDLVESVQADDEDGTTEDERMRRLKNVNAKRKVPVHPELLRMGFIAYVTTTAPGADDPLFPDLEPQGKDGKRGPRMTRWFVEYRKATGIYRPGVAVHALRHNANTRLRNLISGFQHERAVAYMFGHSQGGGEGRERYDKGPGLKEAAATLALLTYPDLDFSHLYSQG